MKPITDGRRDCDDDHMTVAEIVARVRWLEETLTELHRELSTAANPDDLRSPPIFRLH
jgi:hypothetical protein